VRRERAEPPPPHVVSFRGDVYPVLAKHCADSSGCHGDDPTHSVELDLREAAAYSELVGAGAEARPGALRISPGDPAASFLVDKLVGSLHAREGKPMPLDAQTGEPLVPRPVPPQFIDETLKPWILAGAPNN
jgi:hypothetical protein